MPLQLQCKHQQQIQSTELRLTISVKTGRLKMREWKMRHEHNCMVGKCRSGKCRSKPHG